MLCPIEHYYIYREKPDEEAQDNEEEDLEQSVYFEEEGVINDEDGTVTFSLTEEI